ncbi:MAG: FtsX-like permease family protein [Candidatus Paceibacterota bacterium]
MLPIQIGFFLAVRQIRRSTLWSTVLIIAVMTLTFLNLVVVSGILVGLIEGAQYAVRERYTSDVIVSNLRENKYIEDSSRVIRIAESLPNVEAISARYVAGGTIESNYQTQTNENDLPELVSTQIVGINPQKEDAVSGIASLVVEGEYLNADDFDKVVLGSMLLAKYLQIDSEAFPALKDVEIGSKIRLTIGDVVREVEVKGITKSKVDEIDRRVFMVDTQLRSMIGGSEYSVDEIAISLVDEKYADATKAALLANDVDQLAKVQTYIDAQPKFLQDIKKTFALLGAMISSIGLAVAAITIFIVIFINAITRQKYIGIMKAIGVNAKAIEISYIFQSLFYAIVGSVIGLTLLYVILVPYFAANPINFPFSDGILVAPFGSTMFRITLLVLTTVIAGFIPARIVVKKNTLDSILGRR